MEFKASSAIVLLSGGQDSTTALYWAKNFFKEVYTLTISYGQRHWTETFSAEIVAKRAEVENELIVLPPYILKGGLLLNTGEIQKEYDGIAQTFVPGRNLLFLTIAANRAYIKGIKNIVIGTSQVDYSGYPDCKGDFIDSFEECVQYAFEAPFEVFTPLIELSKAETVTLAMSFDGCYEALAYTHTCYNGEFPPCGHCPACLLREKGFLEAGITDPLIERAKHYK